MGVARFMYVSDGRFREDSGSRPSRRTGREIASGMLTTETPVLTPPMCSLASICHTRSASLTPGTARITSRSSSVISIVEVTSRSHSFCVLKKFTASVLSVAAEYTMLRKATAASSPITTIEAKATNSFRILRNDSSS